MQLNTQLSINAAAWFFVGNNADIGSENVQIEVPFRIGRNPDADLCLECASVSGTHAEIVEENGQLWLRDLNSTNGTFLNGLKIHYKAKLSANDTVQFGTTVFQIANATTSASDTMSDLPQGERDTSSPDERFERLFIDGVVPFFQSVLRIGESEHEVMGYEVLGRSRLFGLRTPAQMFAAASRLEMEAELSRVLRKKGIEVADKSLPQEMTLFVNTHAAELMCDGLEESLFEIRDNHPTRPIMLEVHESLLNEAQKFSKLRSTLQNLDIQMAFHDFGAGQLRLAELCEFVPDVVKFDVQLVRGIDKAGQKRQRFLASMVKMLTDIGITPLAECIEQQGECDTLKELGFQLGQGFLFGRPSAITDIVSSDGPATTIDSEPQVKSFLESETAFSDKPKDADWLLAQPKHFYTIQVLSAISEARARDYIAMQENPEQFAVFCKQGKTRLLYIVVHGIFENRSEAKAVAEKHANLSISPWIRLLSSVQSEIQP